VGSQILTRGESTHDPALRLIAHSLLGQMAFYGSDFAAALPHLERAIELYDPGAHSPVRARAFRAGQDLAVTCTAHAALTLWVLGYPARAVARSEEALARSRALQHPLSLTYACHFAAQLHQCRGDRQAMQELEDAVLAQATEHGFGLFLAVGRIHRGWLHADRGHAEEGLAQMREGIAASQEIGAGLRIPAFLASMAEVCAKTRRRAEALSLVSEAFAAAEASGQQYWTAELHRLKGVLAPSPQDAEKCFLDAIGTARRQGAKSFELRAATSLSRLWARQGKPREARALLSDVFAWFTEGFETADLREARALLQKLATAVESPTAL
jgi:adenylate cyclase